VVAEVVQITCPGGRLVRLVLDRALTVNRGLQRPCSAWAADPVPSRGDRNAVETSATREERNPSPRRGRSVLGPCSIENSWSSAGTSGHPRHMRTAGHIASTVPTSAEKAAWAAFKSLHPTAASPPGSCPRGGGRRGRAKPYGQGGANGATVYLTSSSTAVPQACHSQRCGTVPSGQPQTTTKQPRPAPFPILAGDSSARSGFGSKGSLVNALIGPCRTRPADPVLAAEDQIAQAFRRDEAGPGSFWVIGAWRP
jgi:hypothetical protein